MNNKINFTKAALNAIKLPEPGKRIIYYDAKTLGLQLRTTSKGVKTFSVYRRLKGGQPMRITLGQYPHLSIEQARRRAAEINAAVENGKNPVEAMNIHKHELKFKQLFSEYMDRYSKPHKRTWKQDISYYNFHLKTPLGEQKLSEIGRTKIATLHGNMTKAGHSTNANRILSLISSIFNWGTSVGFCDHNPARGIRRNPEKSRERFLQANELPRFFAALAKEPNETIRDYVLISLITGARKSNVLSMRWQDIDFKQGEWCIIHTKNNLPQTVTLSPEAVKILENRKSLTSGPFVFPGTGKHGHLVEPKKGWKRILTQAGIGNLRIHDLRRTLGSWQAKTGASLAIIGKSLNHKDIQSTIVYARLDLDPVRQSVEKATSAIFEAAGFHQIDDSDSSDSNASSSKIE